LRWINHHVDLLNLRRRSRELALYLADALLARAGYQIPNPEVFCVACMFFVMKLETDVNDLVADFLNFVTKDQGISICQLRAAEYNILLNLPDCFCLSTTFSDILSSILSALSSEELHSPINLDLLIELHIKHFIDAGPDYPFLIKCINRMMSIIGTYSSYLRAQALSQHNEALSNTIASKRESLEKLMRDQHPPFGSKKVKLQ